MGEKASERKWGPDCLVGHSGDLYIIVRTFILTETKSLWRVLNFGVT